MNTSKPEADLVNLFSIVSDNYIQVIVTVLMFSVAALLYSLSIEDSYRSEVLLTPADSNQQSNTMASQLGAAAGLVGLNIGTNNDMRVAASLATMESREFIRNFVRKHDLLIPLFAEGYKDGEVYARLKVYNDKTGVWVKQEPSDMEVFRKLSNAMSISEDRASGLISVSIDWQNPEYAANWLLWMISDINQQFKEQDLEEARNAISYLQTQINSTQLVEMQRVLYQLIETQSRVLMLADVRDDYVFRIIDPPYIPEVKSEPNRLLITVIGFTLGLIVACICLFAIRSKTVLDQRESRQV
jgi:uncharacterized protein involved in exopolysaccharide biosynthesis